MKRAACFAIPFVAFALCIAPAFAKTQYRFEVFGAGCIPLDKDFEVTVPQSSSPLTGAQEFSMGVRGGVRFGADGTGHFGQDFIYSYGTNPTRIVNYTTATDFSFTSRTHQFAYNVLWYPGGLDSNKSVLPYVTAGVGGTFFVLTNQTVNDGLESGLGTLRNENVFTFNAGGGIRVRVNSIYGFRFDFRDYMSRPARYGLPKSSSDPQATVFPVTGVMHQLEFSFAFVYHFK